MFERYERNKREHKQTEVQCRTVGLHFTLMVIMDHGGGRSPLAGGTLDWIARQAAATKGERHAEASLKIAKR